MMSKSKLWTPEFFDIFGFLSFIIITIIGGFLLISRESVPDYAIYILLIIGIAGMIVDGTIVYKNFLRRRR